MKSDICKNPSIIHMYIIYLSGCLWGSKIGNLLLFFLIKNQLQIETFFKLGGERFHKCNSLECPKVLRFFFVLPTPLISDILHSSDTKQENFHISCSGNEEIVLDGS